MIGATLYLSGRDASTGEYVKDAMCCSMCQRAIINAGISTVIIRRSENEYATVNVSSEWIENDDSLSGKFGY
jgi:dCMP deaminase